MDAIRPRGKHTSFMSFKCYPLRIIMSAAKYSQLQRTARMKAICQSNDVFATVMAKGRELVASTPEAATAPAIRNEPI